MRYSPYDRCAEEEAQPRRAALGSHPVTAVVTGVGSLIRRRSVQAHDLPGPGVEFVLGSRRGVEVNMVQVVVAARCRMLVGVERRCVGVTCHPFAVPIPEFGQAADPVGGGPDRAAARSGHARVRACHNHFTLPSPDQHGVRLPIQSPPAADVAHCLTSHTDG